MFSSLVGEPDWRALRVMLDLEGNSETPCSVLDYKEQVPGSDLKESQDLSRQKEPSEESR